MGNYRNLIVWREAVDLVAIIYSATSNFPKEETFGLRLQMRQAAVSIPSNIAEGEGRWSTADHRRFLMHARGSLLELETQVLIAERLSYLNDCEAIHRLTSRVGRRLNRLIRYLSRPDK